MILIFTKIIGIYLCIYGSNDSNYPQEYRKFLHKSFTFKFQYLTIIGLYITLLTLSLYLIHQLIARFFNKNIRILNTTSTLLHSIILPIEILITVIFWTLFLINPRLIVCEIVYEKCGMNFYRNVCMHFVPLVLLAIEGYYAQLQRSNFHVFILIVFGMCYYLFVKDIALREKRWPYPFLDKVGEWQRIVIFCSVTGMCIFFYELCMYFAAKEKKKID